jgi:hypothetical protein
LVPTIPEVTKAATRWIRPFVPPIVTTAVETATKPLRGMRQIFEEQEEVHFSMRRSRTVTVHTEESVEEPADPPVQSVSGATTRTVVSSQRGNVGQRGAPSLGTHGPGQLPSGVDKRD